MIGMELEEKDPTNRQNVSTLESVKDMILTDEEYSHHPFASIESHRVYFVELKNENKELIFFGSPHMYNPADPLFEEVKKKFDEAKPEIVYVEGREYINEKKEKVREALGKESLEGVKLEGEGHYVLKLAVDAGIDFESPEPDFSKEIQYMVDKNFAKMDIFNFYMYRDIDQYQRLHREKSLEGCKNYLVTCFRQFRKESGWESSEIDAFEKDLLSELNIEDKKKYSREVDPIPWKGRPQTPLNEISRQSGIFRDRYMIERIAEGLKKYSKLFVIYGSAHAVRQEPALRALLEM